MEIDDFKIGDKVRILIKGKYAGVFYHPGEIWYVIGKTARYLQAARNKNDTKYVLLSVKDSPVYSKECELVVGNENQPEPTYEIY